MREKRSPNGQPDDARTQRTILNLLLDPDRQRPFSEAELARATGEQTAAKVAIGELYDAGIIHRWEQLVTATHPAVRYHELTHGERADLGDRHEHTLIELLLEEPEHGAHETRLIDTLAAGDQNLQIETLDALDRLDRAGLIERRGQQVYAAQLLIRLDALSL